MPQLPFVDSEEPRVLTDRPLLPGLPGFAGKFIPLEQARDLYQQARRAPRGFRLEALLSMMRINLEVQPADLDRIPVKGPLVAVANHPLGVLDGAALAVLLSRVRPDTRILTNSLLESIPELHEHCIFIDPFRTPSSADKNVKPLQQALEWLRADLAIYAKQLPGANAHDRTMLQKQMEHWRRDDDLITLRDAAALAKLAADERAAARVGFAFLMLSAGTPLIA